MKTIHIQGMHCEKCAQRVEKALTPLAKDIRVDHAAGIATLTPRLLSNDKKLKEAVEALGFEVTSIE